MIMSFVDFLKEFGPNLVALGAIIWIVVMANPQEREVARKDYLQAAKDQREDYLASLKDSVSAFQTITKADQEARHAQANQLAALTLTIERLIAELQHNHHPTLHS